MILPDRVLVYGDCAVVPKPTAKQLAEIAITSAESAKAFGIEPKVVLLSYSSGTSGSGEDVDKVREATEIVKAQRRDFFQNQHVTRNPAHQPARRPGGNHDGWRICHETPSVRSAAPPARHRVTE